MKILIYLPDFALLAAALVAMVTLATAAQSPVPNPTFVLTASTLSYHMSHPVHEVDGISRAAKGKGVCHDGVCDFLLATPVKTFDSGDTNRDLHMLQVTRGADFPIVTVRFRIPQTATLQPEFETDLEVNFAGTTDHYYKIPFHQEIKGSDHRITGTIPTTLSGFKIPPPSFLAVNIKNEIPVRVDTTWTQQ